MPDSTPGSGDQRRHPRYLKRLAVDVHVMVLPEPPTASTYEAGGRTVDIGRGGLLVRLDRDVRPGQKVRLRFSGLPGNVRVWPMVISGTIVRLEPAGESEEVEVIPAGSLMAVEFAEPLEELEVPESQ